MTAKFDHDTFSRRDFFSTIAAAALIGSGAAEASASLVRSRSKVIVIGAGMSGLCAAYELEQRGHSVTVLEADAEHIGGRVRTARFGGGAYGELGAMRIPASHHLTHHYIKLLGLRIRPFVEYNPKAYYYVHNRRRRNEEVPHLDSHYTSGMDGRGGGIWSQKFTEIEGGMDSLASAFVSKLKSKPLRGAGVVGIRQDRTVDSSGVTVTYEQRVPAKAVHSLQADFVICTVPLPVLHHIKFDPPLSNPRLQAINGTPYFAANKVLAVCSQRFWETDDGIYGGGTYTDMPIGMTYYPADNATVKDADVSRRPGVLLASYALGNHAEKYDAMRPEAVAASALDNLAKVHSQLRKTSTVQKSLSWSWAHHRWSGGGFAAPGKREDLRKDLMTSEGRVLFAGEHTSQNRSWIQGALESGLRVVHEITQRSGS